MAFGIQIPVDSIIAASSSTVHYDSYKNMNTPQKYEYKFVSDPLKGEFFTGNLKPCYQEDIEKMSLGGWRFVQAIFPTISAGYAEKGDLRFERIVTNSQPNALS